MDRFDDVYVVSDLHLGGDAGSQIFKGTELLRTLIETVAGGPQERRRAFVINGDFVDFLAEPGARYFDPDGAADKLDRISRAPAFAPIWQALRKLVQTQNCELIVVLGNHDLELALPKTQSAFIRSIAPDEDAARGRIRCSTMGAGFSALVGNARVVCLHGNEVDPFNVTDFEQLRRMARDQGFGRVAESWTPNAGTKLVIDIMNGIKRRYPFIDLLKPETDAVLPVLFALDQVNVDRVLDAVEVAARLGWDGIRRVTGLLSAAEADAGAHAAALPASTTEHDSMAAKGRAAADLMALLGRAFEVPPSTGETSAVNNLLDETEKRFRLGVDPLQMSPDHLEDRLGAWNLTKAALRAGWAKLIGRTPAETMQSALRHLRRDKSFASTYEDDTAKRIDEIVPVGVDFVIAGHTHLRRAHPRSRGGTYLNTGTWARLIRMNQAVLDDTAVFAQLYKALMLQLMSELDKAEILLPDQSTLPVVIHLPSVAHVERRPDSVVGVLYEVVGEGGGINPKEVQS